MKKKLSKSQQTLASASKAAWDAYEKLSEEAPLEIYDLLNDHTQTMILYFAALFEHYGEGLSAVEAAEIMRTHALDLVDDHNAYASRSIDDWLLPGNAAMIA